VSRQDARLFGDETIVAVSTPPGRGAVALVRMSGARAFEIAKRHVMPWPEKARTAFLTDIADGDSPLDQALTTLFPGPESFTGEDVVELWTHGGHVVPLSVAAAFIRSGARQATAGEFTRRAVLNGKLDLVQAEGLGELIGSRSTAMQRAALSQLHGGLSRKLADLRSQFLSLEALIAYEIDFPEEDDGPIDEAEITRASQKIVTELEALLATTSLGKVIRDGAVVVIGGPANSGKSSLFNALLGAARAIVTDVPGTTRDAIEAVVDVGEWPLRLVDTAGLREASDRIERLGIEISERYMKSADVVLACADSADELVSTLAKVRTLTDMPVICVRTKADLDEMPATAPGQTRDCVFVSAEARTGLEGLIDRITDHLRATYGDHGTEIPMLTTARQAHAIETALSEMRSFLTARSDERVPAIIAAVHLRECVRVLEELIGAVDIEDVLDTLFSTFCVGK